MAKALFIFFLLLTACAVLAEGGKISVERNSFSDDPREVTLAIQNTWSEELHGVDIFIDGELRYHMETPIPSGTKIVISTYLDAGEHLIEVRSSDNAYDSLPVNVAVINLPKARQPVYIEYKWLLLTGLAVLVVAMVVLWFVARRPRLKY